MIGRAKVMDVVPWTRCCRISSLDFEREKRNIVERVLTLGDDALGFVESLFLFFPHHNDQPRATSRTIITMNPIMQPQVDQDVSLDAPPLEEEAAAAAATSGIKSSTTT